MFCIFFKILEITISASLYGFQHPSQYGDGIIHPIRKINTDLIIEGWDQVQRIMVSLALKTTTQSIITGKLSAYARKNKTRQALWEYDHIIRSTIYPRWSGSTSISSADTNSLSIPTLST